MGAVKNLTAMWTVEDVVWLASQLGACSHLSERLCSKEGGES